MSRFRLVTDDAAGYWLLAGNLVRHHAFSRMDAAPYLPDAIRTPGYPLFVAGVLSAVGEHPWILLALQAIIGLAAIYFIYRSGEILFGELAGQVAGALAALDLYMVQYSLIVWSDWLFTLDMSIAIFLMARILGHEGRSRKIELGLGLALGIGALIRPVGLMLVVPVLLFLLGLKLTRGELAIGYLRRAGLVLLGWGIAIAPWVARNWIVFGEPGFSASGGFNLLFGTAVVATARDEGRPGIEVYQEFMRRYYRSRGDFAMAGAMTQREGDYYARMGMTIVARHPVATVATHAQGIFMMVRRVGGEFVTLKPQTDERWSLYKSGGLGKLLASERKGGPNVDLIFFFYNGLFLMSLYLGSAAGVTRFGALLTQSRAFLLFLLLYSGYFALTAGNIGGARLRLPIHPALEILAGLGIATALGWGHSQFISATRPVRRPRRDEPTGPRERLQAHRYGGAILPRASAPGAPAPAALAPGAPVHLLRRVDRRGGPTPLD